MSIKNILKENVFRIAYILITLVLIFLCYKFKVYFLEDDYNFKVFSYVGVVATILALVIAVFEILQAISIAKSINEKSKELLNQAKTIEKAAKVSYCMSLIDSISNNITDEQYKEALLYYQFFRMLVSDMSLNYESNELDKIELILSKFTRTTATAEPSKPQKTKLTKSVIELKNKLNEDKQNVT